MTGSSSGYSNRHSHCWAIASISSGDAFAGSSPLIGVSPVADSSPSRAAAGGRPLTPTCAVGLALRPSGPDASISRAFSVITTPKTKTASASHGERGDHRAQRAAAGGQLARLGAAAVAEADDGGDQRGVDDQEEDEDDHDRHPVGVARSSPRSASAAPRARAGRRPRAQRRPRAPRARTGQREWRSDGDGPRRRHCNRGGRGSGPRSLRAHILAPPCAGHAQDPRRCLGYAVRAAAAGVLAASVAVPLLRKRLRIRPATTLAALVGGPLALAVLTERSKARDAALFGLQMWGFMQAHELPYDNPAALERRLKVRYPIAVDRVARRRRAAERPPPAPLCDAPGDVSALDRALSIVHWAWFIEPHASLLWVQRRHVDRFPRAARQMAATYDLGCLLYFAVPTAPPWYASELGETEGEVRRIMGDAGEDLWGERAWAALENGVQHEPVGGDAVASLRDLGDGGDPPRRDRAPSRGARLGLRGDARLRARLPRRALRHRPDRRRGARRRRPPRRAGRRAAGRSGQPRAPPARGDRGGRARAARATPYRGRRARLRRLAGVWLGPVRPKEARSSTRRSR